VAKNNCGNSTSGSVWSFTTGSNNVGSATRDLPNCYVASAQLLVTIAVVPGPATQSYAAEDIPPNGWTGTNINEGGQWDDVNKKVKWGPHFDKNYRTLTYNATPRRVILVSNHFLAPPVLTVRMLP
jgi:hypothetical protein